MVSAGLLVIAWGRGISYYLGAVFPDSSSPADGTVASAVGRGSKTLAISSDTWLFTIHQFPLRALSLSCVYFAYSLQGGVR